MKTNRKTLVQDQRKTVCHHQVAACGAPPVIVEHLRVGWGEGAIDYQTVLDFLVKTYPVTGSEVAHKLMDLIGPQDVDYPPSRLPSPEEHRDVFVAGNLKVDTLDLRGSIRIGGNLMSRITKVDGPLQVDGWSIILYTSSLETPENSEITSQTTPSLPSMT